MGIAYRIDLDRGVTFVLWDKRVTAVEFLAHVRKLISDSEWPPAKRLHLCDLRHATLDASIDEAKLKEAADLYGTKREKIAMMKIAIVAGDAFAKSTLFERFVSHYGPTVIVFNNLETACAWLGIAVSDAKQSLDGLRGASSGAVNG
ncbi:MAG: hypothetical protein HY292_11085 [Planctomycetes bacterium]|nr:hypothetical protein [Planctomycetota bacterium]